MVPTYRSLSLAARNIDSHPAFRRALKSHIFHCAAVLHNFYPFMLLTIVMPGHYKTFSNISISINITLIIVARWRYDVTLHTHVIVTSTSISISTAHAQDAAGARCRSVRPCLEIRVAMMSSWWWRIAVHRVSATSLSPCQYQSGSQCDRSIRVSLCKLFLTTMCYIVAYIIYFHYHV